MEKEREQVELEKERGNEDSIKQKMEEIKELRRMGKEKQDEIEFIRDQLNKVMQGGNN